MKPTVKNAQDPAIKNERKAHSLPPRRSPKARLARKSKYRPSAGPLYGDYYLPMIIWTIIALGALWAIAQVEF